MKKFLILGMTVLILSLAFVGCDEDDNTSGGAKDIILEGSDELPLGATFDLSAAKFTIGGKEAAGVEITWAIKDAKGTGATINGTTLNANEFGIGTNWGEVVLTAAAVGQDFTKDFSFYLKRWNPTTKTAYLTAVKGSGYGAWETGDAIFINSVVNNFSLAANTGYNVAISGILSGELGDDSFQFYFLNTAPPNYNFLAISDYVNAAITDAGNGAGTATAIVTTINNFASTNRSYDRIGIQISKGEQGISDSDVGKVMLKISNMTVSITSNGENEKTYSLYGVGVSQTEWNSIPLLGSGLAPSALINKSLTASEVDEAFTILADDDDGTQLSNQTEAQLREILSGYGSDVDTIIDKLEQQGWVLYATTQTQDSNDYADIIGIR